VKWDDITAEKHWLLQLGRWKLKGCWGLVLKRINELIAASADNKNKETVKREVLYEVRIFQ
jgi:hypothetical protein